MCLGLWFVLVGTQVNIIVAIAAARTAERLRGGRVAVSGAVRYVAASLMGAMALRLALPDRR